MVCYRPMYFCPACRLFWGWEDRRMARPSCGTPRHQWCGQCYSNVRGRTNHSGHRGYRAACPRKDGGQLALTKPAQSGANGSGSQLANSQSTYLVLFSDLMAFLSCPSWGDGSRRELGTLSIAVTAGRWSGRLKDPNGKRYAYLTALTIDELLEGLEKGLATDTLDWREDKPFKPGGR